MNYRKDRQPVTSSESFLDNINSAMRLIPGSGLVLDAALAATSGTVQGAIWGANELGKFGKRIGGTPGEISAALFGAGLGAMSGFFLGPILGTNIAQSNLLDPRYVPRAARTVEMEEVFSLYTVGQGKFGQNPQYTAIQMDLYDLSGRWLGFLTGLQLNQTPASQLFQALPPPQGAIDSPPVPHVEITEWTNSFYVFADGSTIITEGMARSYLVPQRDESLLFMVSNSHVITKGTGVYEGAQGIKQGIGAVYVPPGEFPGKFPSPGYEFPVNTIDTFRLIKKNFFNLQNPFSRKEPKAPPPTRSATLIKPERTADAREDERSSGPTIIDSLRVIIRSGSASPFDLSLPDVSGADTRAYKTANLFRRYGVGEGQISKDRKYFSFKGEFFLLDEQRDGQFEGIYEFVQPLSSLGEIRGMAMPPFNLQTLSINQVPPQAFCKERWDFADGDLLTVVGAAVFHAAELLTKEGDFWISTYEMVTDGGGKFEGCRGVKTSALSIFLPAGESLQQATRVFFKTIDVFVVLREKFIGTIGPPANPSKGAGPINNKGSAARFNYPVGVAVDSKGNVYVADHNNHAIRKITPDGVVSTLAGSLGEVGSIDGKGSAARFHGTRGVAVDSRGNVYVADNLNNTIRKITPDGVVSTLAGSPGQVGSADGRGSAARFDSPMGMAVDSKGNVYVADFNNSTIRKITPDGVVSTLAGSPGQAGSADGRGSAARFNHAGGIGVDLEGNVYVGDSGNNTVRKITPDGVVSTRNSRSGA